VTDYMHHYHYFSCFCSNYYVKFEFTVRNANKGQLLKPEERGWRWTGLYQARSQPKFLGGGREGLWRGKTFLLTLMRISE